MVIEETTEEPEKGKEGQIALEKQMEESATRKEWSVVPNTGGEQVG